MMLAALPLHWPAFNIGRTHALALIAACALLLPWFIITYSAERALLPVWSRRVLLLLRLVIAATVLLMIARPSLLSTEEEVHTPVLPILVDGSKSMTFPDASGNPLTASNPRAQRQRFDAACAAVQLLEQKLGKSHDLQAYTFSDGLQRIGGDAKTPDLSAALAATTPAGEYTNIGDSICDTLANYSDRKLPGLVLVSDGRQTGGREVEEAIALAKRAAVPIHTVMLGSEFPLCDLRIDEATAPPEVCLGDVLAVNVLATNQVTDPLSINAKLMLGDQTVADKNLSLKRGQSRFGLYFMPEKEGEYDLRVVLPHCQDEVDLTNNEATVHVRVIKHSLRTLLIAGKPNLDYHYLVPALLHDPVVDLSTYLQSADIDYVQQGNTNIEQLPKTLKEWEAYDVIILYDPDPGPNGLTSAQITGIEHAVTKGRGLMFIAGRNFTLKKLVQIHGAKVRALLPVEIEVNAPPDEATLFEKPQRVTRSAQGRSHPVMLCDSRGDMNEKIWQTFPPVYWRQETAGLKNGAISLLDVESNGGHDCLMAVQRYDQGVVFFLGSNSFYSWRFPYGSYQYDRFWSRAIRYLGESQLAGKQVQVALSTDKRLYAPGERAKIKLDVLDPALFEQLATAEIYCKATDSTGSELMLPLQRTKDGMQSYSAEFPIIQAGETKLRVRQIAPNAGSDTKPIFDVSASFQVQARSLEEIDTSGDMEQMKKIAAETGGRFFCYRDMRELESLSQIIPADKEVLTRERTSEIWDTWTLLMAVFAIAAAEWSLRKAWGLL